MSRSDTPLLLLLTLGDGVQIRAEQYLQVIEIELSSASAWTGMLSLFDADGDTLDALIFQTGRGAPIDVTIGHDEAHAASRTFKGRVLVPSPRFTINGTFLTLEMVSASSYVDVMDRKTRGHGSGQRISDVVRSIASERGWTVTDTRGRGTIEPTHGSVEDELSSVGESDFKFIREQLVGQALNAQGTGDYRAYFDGEDVFHFHTPNYLQPVKAHLTFARDPGGEIIQFEPADTSVFAAVLGGGTAVYAAAASSEGEVAEVPASHTDGVEGLGTAVEEGAEHRPALSASAITARPLMAARTPAHLARLTKAQWDRLRRLSFQASLVRHGSHALDVLDYAEVDVYTPRDVLHYMSGSFQVFSVRHKVDASGWETTYDLVRGGVGAVPGSEPQSKASTFTPPTSAPAAGHRVEAQTNG